ncbi:MAG: SDR family oxidoreductase [Myxococcales bacterium]|nr:SDR family oxidoreductase [Myxococcales bacterium]
MANPEQIKPPFEDQGIQPPGLEAEMPTKPIYHNDAYRPSGKLEGCRALVTGGDSGIGRAVAALFAREGADVAIVHLPQEAEDARETARYIEARGRRAVCIAGDVTEKGFAEEAVSECVHGLGGLDILVNNAAVQEHIDDVDDLSIEHWRRTFDVNVLGYFSVVKAALPHLRPGSAIINTGSITGLEGSKGLLDYSATKGAIHAFTKSLAKQLIKRRIRVNCVAPGPVWTPLNPAERDDIEHFGEGTPLGRPAQPAELAPAYVFLASNADTGYMTGEVLTLLGGDTRAA